MKKKIVIQALNENGKTEVVSSFEINRGPNIVYHIGQLISFKDIYNTFFIIQTAEVIMVTRKLSEISDLIDRSESSTIEITFSENDALISNHLEKVNLLNLSASLF